MEDKNKTYTSTDFARYHAGAMTPGEMHALEAAALEDPFLADALEGYNHATDAKSDIEELKRRLANKKKKNNVFLISSITQNPWWRIAALFIIIAGAGYIFLRINYKNKEHTLAKHEVIKTRGEVDSTALTAEIKAGKADSTTSNNEIAFEKQQPSRPVLREKLMLPEVRQRSPKNAAASPKRVSPSLAQSSYADALNDSLNDSLNVVKSTKDALRKNSVAPNEYALKGQVTDEQGNPVPSASITNKARTRATITDTSGRFFLQSKDSSMTAIATAPGYEAKSFSLKKDENSTIALNKSSGELSEVVVTGYGSPTLKQVKTSISPSEVLNGKVAGVDVAAKGAQPFAKSDKFEQYLQENIKPIYDENAQRLTGEILLSFTINKKGKPGNIKVVRSSCKTCEQKAIQLLQKGPSWTGKKNTPGSVLIKF